MFFSPKLRLLVMVTQILFEVLDSLNADGTTTRQFPKLANLFDSTKSHANLLHMKSEIVVKKIFMEENGEKEEENVIIAKDYMLDEWYKDQQTARLKTSRMKHNFDLLIDNFELFDLSIRYKCYRSPPVLEPIYIETKSNLIEFLNNKTTLIVHLSHLYYSPVGLWSMAERLEPNLRELISNPDDETTEVWRIKSPPRRSYNMGQQQWQYDMEFKREIGIDTGEFHYVLNSIEIHDRDDDSNEYITQVDVSNYRYQLSEREVAEVDPFRLPEAYGCSRNSLQTKRGDEFTLPKISEAINLGYLLNYEATLESFDFKHYLLLQNRHVFPRVTGSWLNLSSLRIASHLSRSHQNDGTFRAYKSIYDASNGFLQTIDKTSGLCERKKALDFDFVLKFQLNDLGREEMILLDEQVIETLFLNTMSGDEKFGLVNRDRVGEAEIVTYEKQVNNLRLSHKLSGPAAIIRTFTKRNDKRIENREISGSHIDYHDSIKVRVYLFDEVRLMVNAILTINIQKMEVNSLVDSLAKLQVAQCSTSLMETSSEVPQIETFVLEYELNQNQASYVDYMIRSRTMDSIYNALMRHHSITPFQLDGNMKLKVDYSEAQVRDSESLVKIQVFFNVQDPPTAYLMHRKMHNTRLNYILEDKSQMRLVDSLDECSSWCDAIDCSSITYCSDHSCYITGDSVDSNVEKQTINDENCSFYYRCKQITNLKKFEHSLGHLINLDRDAETLFNLNITLDSGIVVLPSRVSLQGDKFSHDDQGLDLRTNSKESYKTIETKFKIDAATFIKYLKNHEKVAKKFKLKLFNDKKTQVDCLRECEHFNRQQSCIFISHCKLDKQCLLVHLDNEGEQISLNAYDERNLLENTMVPSDNNHDECRVTMRDFTSEFERFTSTKRPQSYMTQLDGYDVTKCAAACKLHPNCWSFDVCVPKIGGNSATCYLQTTHMSSPTFDKSDFLSSKTELTSNTTTEICSHYSRTVIDDFKVIQNSRSTMSLSQISEGIGKEGCALDCELNDSCLGFEYCLKPNQAPTQSCRYINIKLGDQRSSLHRGDIDSNLVQSNDCSIYLLAKLETSQVFEQLHNESEYYEQNNLISIVFYYILKIFASMGLGMFIHFTYKTLVGVLETRFEVRRPSKASVRL